MIADILGVQKSTVKNVANLNERLKATKPVRQKGPGRDVLQLYGNASLASLPIQSSEGFSSRRTGDTAVQWVWCRLHNSAHPANDNIHLHHWHLLKNAKRVPELDQDCAMKAEEASPIQRRATAEASTTATSNSCSASEPSHHKPADACCCSYVSSNDYAAAAFNRKAQVLRYSSSFYAKHIAANSSGWTSWECDYLFDLCEEFDLRFTIIHDRYAPLEVLEAALVKQKEGPAQQQPTSAVTRHQSKSRKRLDSTLGPHSATAAVALMSAEQIRNLMQQVEAHQPRRIEHLKDRYYKIARIIIEQDFRKKIQSIEAGFTEMLKNIDCANVANMEDGLKLQKQQMLAEAKDELSRHPLIKFNYDPAVDQQRREYVEQHYKAGEKTRRGEQELLQQVIKEEAAMGHTATTRMDSEAPKKAQRDEPFAIKKSKSASGGAGVSGGHNTGEDDEYYNQMTLEAVQQHMATRRRPGTVLASQMMLQFASPLLLAPVSTIQPTAAAGVAPGVVGQQLGGAAGSATAAGAHSQHPHHRHHHHQHPHHPHGLQIVKKHEQRIEHELKLLGFDSKAIPLWPNYNDSEIVAAFNALRIDIATLVQYNAKVDQLTKEVALWKSKIGPLQDEPCGSRVQTSSSQEALGRKTGGAEAAAAGVMLPGMNYSNAGGSNKKKHGRRNPGDVSGERPMKKPRKPSKKAAGVKDAQQQM